LGNLNPVAGTSREPISIISRPSHSPPSPPNQSITNIHIAPPNTNNLSPYISWIRYPIPSDRPVQSRGVTPYLFFFQPPHFPSSARVPTASTPFLSSRFLSFPKPILLLSPNHLPSSPQFIMAATLLNSTVHPPSATPFTSSTTLNYLVYSVLALLAFTIFDVSDGHAFPPISSLQERRFLTLPFVSIRPGHLPGQVLALGQDPGTVLGQVQQGLVDLAEAELQEVFRHARSAQGQSVLSQILCPFLVFLRMGRRSRFSRLRRVVGCGGFGSTVDSSSPALFPDSTFFLILFV
jgi:hypothetical protein